jgi:hypothetical protein
MDQEFEDELDRDLLENGPGEPPFIRLAKAEQKVRELAAANRRLQAALAEARANYTVVGNKLAAATGRDLPELDGTDAAHPAWWRGQNYGAASICRALTEVLDGKEPTGTCAEPYETLRRRAWQAREDAARLTWAWEYPEAFATARRTTPPNLTGRQQIDVYRGKP